jgi:Domain of unknown function (DUF4349)
MRKLLIVIMLGLGLFTGMVGLRYLASSGTGAGLVGATQEALAFSLDRKNYASQKVQGTPGQSIGDSQKYEKVATVGLATNQFDDHRSSIERTIVEAGGQVQLERLQGLVSRRVLNLGIGIPPEKFDAFISDIRKLGRETGLTVVKNDKTNEYLRMRAKRASLEKTRGQLENLQAAGGSVDERLKVQTQLSELEEKIQEMAVSLGEFDVQNELCTVKLTLAEERATVRPSSLQRLNRAITSTIPDFAFLTFGLLAVAGAFWFASSVFAFGRRMLAEKKL